MEALPPKISKVVIPWSQINKAINSGLENRMLCSDGAKSGSNRTYQLSSQFAVQNNTAITFFTFTNPLRSGKWISKLGDTITSSHSAEAAGAAVVGKPAFNIKAPGSSGQAECYIDFQVERDLVVTFENSITGYDVKHGAKIVGVTVIVQIEINRNNVK